MSRELLAMCDEIDADGAVGALVLRGAGGYFCSGGDRQTLAKISEDPSSIEGRRALDAIYASFRRLSEMGVVTIAALRGGAVGAGMNLAMSVHARVVAADARLASGFFALGVHPGGGHLRLLNQAVGVEATVGMALLNQTLTGIEAAARGLALEAVPDAEVEPRAMELAATAGADPELARRVVNSLHRECGPGAVPPDVSEEIEREPQLWSFARKGRTGWSRRERVR
jgi:enoyl-CoA hydratase